MKRTLLFITCILASLVMLAQAYFPEGTKWTEIRLDTLKYDSWYSKVGDEWVANFETIEYYIKGEFIDKSRGDGKDKYRCVYTNGPEWTDSLTLLLQEEGDAEYVGYNTVMVSVLAHDDDGSSRTLWPGEAYQFDWTIGKGLYFKDILLSNTTSFSQSYCYYGIIDEIKEGNFGGVRPLKYVDLDGKAPENDPNSPIRNASTQGGRILQGIGITEWNDGECLFGPPNPYGALRMFDSFPEEKYPQRHYRSMLVHFERNGEVLYDVRPILPQNDYHPLLEEGKVWKYGYNNLVKQYMKSLTIDGDTIIGDQTYMKIIDVASQGIEMFLREEGKKVYCCYPNRETEILLYDFGKNAGEIISREIRNGDTWIQKVVAVDTIMIKDNSFRCMTVHEYGIPEGMSEETYFAGNYGYDSGFWIEGIGSLKYLDTPIGYDGNYYSFYECQIGDVTYKQKDFLDAIKNNTQPAYRPFVEEGKVWKVGAVGSGNPVQLVDYYYFDGDTIINGKTCKQMMCQVYYGPYYPDLYLIDPLPSLSYIGAWYEEDKKVYFCNATDQQFELMCDFSVNADDTLQIHNQSYVIGPKQTGGLKGFKGVYRDVMMPWDEEQNIYNTTWLEGVGNIDGPIYSVYLGEEAPALFLMSCTVGDEVIYLNDEYEDGATPESMGARKRFDFTHTIKTKPKARNRSEANQSLYGEYNDQQLGINLDPLDDAYLVRITDESDKVVYEKTINAGNIVGLNIDISAYAKGRYTVTVENSDETYTGEFAAQTTGIRDVRWKKEEVGTIIYNLQGQRLSTLQKGLNIVNGQKVFVK